MKIRSAHSMKTEIDRKLHQLVEASITFNKSKKDLSILGISVSPKPICLYDSTVEVLVGYFNLLSDEITKAFNNETKASFSLDYSFYLFEANPPSNYVLKQPLKNNILDAINLTIDEQHKLIDEIVSTIPFDCIEKEFQKGACLLETEVLALMANNCAYDFNVNSFQRKWRISGGHIILNTPCAIPYAHEDKQEELTRTIILLQTISKCSNVNFGPAIKDLLALISSIDRSSSIPSRTTFGKGEAITVRCYKDRYDYCLTPDAFDAIYAFVTMYGTDKAVDSFSKISYALELQA